MKDDRTIICLILLEFWTVSLGKLSETTLQPFFFGASHGNGNTYVSGGFSLKPFSRPAFPTVFTNMDSDDSKDASIFDAFKFAGLEFSRRKGGKNHTSAVNEKLLS